MSTLVLLRHGQSQWNKLDLFTGWYDSDLSPGGEDEAREAGRLLAAEGIVPSVVHTSLLTRAIRTADLALDVAGLAWLPVRRSWRLNERHYGDLEGKNKAEVKSKYGDDQFMLWRRSFDTPPPPLSVDDARHPSHDARYRLLPADALPASECLKDVVARVLPYWHDVLVADLRSGRTPLVAAHGNSLRALVKHLDGISDTDIAGLNIPTGVPLVYELDDSLRPVSSRYLGDPDDVARRAAAVAQQGSGSP
ncbi:MAG: 2,3-bisphosphoglycerate-dependent phosphoglycerate mutase [Actinomycetota bacterium]|jgi:2,3-bisphosphoglycerate-dependent phosphoglycerate mutase|nr:2,3-bisphosphoglycerate-dependent phosphoglycerate mutase [Actinomycetota bacterium]